MARQIHYQVCFKSMDGNTYAVNLYEEDYTGNIVQLTPAANPFETRENDDDDVFCSICNQSGYIRVIDTDNEIFDQIIPANNTTLLVRVYKGSWTNGAFVPETGNVVLWQGFVQSQVYTQPWTDHKSVLELPVESMLGALEMLYMPTGSMRVMPLREVFTLAAAALGVDDVWTNVVFQTDWMLSYPVFWNVNVLTAAWQSEEINISTLNMKKVKYVGHSFLDILKGIAKLFGVSFREDGQTLYCEQMQKFDSTNALDVQFSSFSQSAPVSTSAAFVDSSLDNQFVSTANMKSIEQGARSVKVSLPISRRDFDVLSLPEAEEDESEVYMVRAYKGNSNYDYYNLYVQSPAVQESANTEYDSELFNEEQGGIFRPCPDANIVGDSLTAIDVGSTTNPVEVIDQSQQQVWHTAVEKDVVFYGTHAFIWHDGAWMYMEEYPSIEEQIRNTSIFKDPLSYVGFSPWNTATGIHVDYPPNTTIWIRYGALPVRFHLAETDEEVVLEHGVYFNLHCQNFINMMTVKSPVSYSNAGDYLNINFDMLFFSTSHPGHRSQHGDPPEWEWVWDMEDWKLRNVQPASLELFFMLKFGGKWWNGSAWQSTETSFTLTFVDGRLPENYEPSMLVEDLGGYYIPIDDTLSGVVEFSWRGANTYGTYDENGGPSVEPHGAIVSGFTCNRLVKNQLYVSQTEENNYYAKINDGGFMDDKVIELDFGTNCNNDAQAVNLIVDSNNTKIEKITYNDNSQQRPEQHLLAQMKKYYSQIRRTYKGWFSSYVQGKNWYKTVISFGGRKYYGIIKRKLWKEGKEEVKLVETHYQSNS